MDVSRRSLGAAVALVASMVSVVIPILVVMGGGALLALDGAAEGEGPGPS